MPASEAERDAPIDRIPAGSRLPRPAVTVIVGAAMGMADLVPGFSGGTVALLAGVYERLVANVRQGAHALALIGRGRPRAAGAALAAVQWRFLLPLLAGIAAVIATLAGPLHGLLERHPQTMSAVFAGLVLGAVVVAARDLRRPRPGLLAVGLLVAAVTFAGLGASEGAVSDPSLLYLAGAGAVAVCAMILPGVSGSFLLLLLGVYDPVLAAVEARDAVTLLTVAAGGAVGLASFATLLAWLLARQHDWVLAALLGLMVGSLRVLWPWPGVEVGDPTLAAPTLGEVPAVGGAGAVALLAVIALGLLARRFTRDPA